MAALLIIKDTKHLHDGPSAVAWSSTSAATVHDYRLHEAFHRFAILSTFGEQSRGGMAFYTNESRWGWRLVWVSSTLAPTFEVANGLSSRSAPQEPWKNILLPRLMACV